MQLSVLQDPESQTRHGSEKPYWSRSLEGLGTWVDQAWRVSCYLCIPTYCLVDRFTAWRATERFFAEFFNFLFDNIFGGQQRGFSPSSSISSSITHQRVILFFHSLFPYSCALLLLLVVHAYALEQFYWFIALHLLLFRTQISQSKSNLAVIFNWGSKQALVF